LTKIISIYLHPSKEKFSVINLFTSHAEKLPTVPTRKIETMQQNARYWVLSSFAATNCPGDARDFIKQTHLIHRIITEEKRNGF
jgi:hypothetical protein